MRYKCPHLRPVSPRASLSPTRSPNRFSPYLVCTRAPPSPWIAPAHASEPSDFPPADSVKEVSVGPSEATLQTPLKVLVEPVGGAESPQEFDTLFRSAL
eukprot:2656066-Pyramimonas_sp.AAC.1